MIDTRNNLPDMTDALKKVYEDEKYGYDKDGNSKNPKDKKKERWQDDDGDGKWYEKSDVDGKISKREKEEKKKNQKEEVEVVNEISADLALKASKKAVAGDKAGAAKKSAQAVRLYKAQAKKRLNREETEILDDLLESGLFSDEEIEAILKMNEEE